MRTIIISSHVYIGLVFRLNSKFEPLWGLLPYLNGYPLTQFIFRSEMQSELPLWSSGLESLGYSDPFPSKANSTSPEDKIEDDSDSPAKPPSDNSASDEERGWILYIGAICNRRTVNDMLIDMWRSGEDEWITNVGSVVQRTAEAVKVVDYWYVEAI